MSSKLSAKYSSVPASVDLENNSNTKKYRVNDNNTKGKLVISKWACFFLIMGAILLATLTTLLVYFFVPPYYTFASETPPEALTKKAEVNLFVPSSLNVNKPITVPKVGHLKDTRLPKNIIPISYKLQLVPFLDEDNFTTQGSVSMEIQCLEPTDKIRLNLVDITIDRSSVRVKYLKDDYFLRVTDYINDGVAQIFTFQLDRKLIKDGVYKLDMSFTGVLNDLNQGFYRSRYEDSATNQVSEQLSGYVWDNYQETPPMSTYLVAFVVSDLQPYEFNTDGREFTIWTRKEIINQAVYASTIAPKVLKYYEKYFDVKYPLPKVDVVAVPEFGFGAMENWGLITFRESALLIDPKTALVDDNRHAAMIMSHELTHQWFGNLVTPKWWDDLWLKEGFATYFQYRGTNHVEPSWNVTQEFFHTTMGKAMQLDALASSKALKSKLASSNQVREHFNDISYSKGASIIGMVQHVIGEETFREGLEQFLKRHTYGNADADDLWDAFLDKQPVTPGIKGVDLKVLLRPWIEQAGFPVVSATANYNTSTITLKQKRYFLSGKQNGAESAVGNESWYIPISATSAADVNFDDTKPKVWLRPDNDSVTFNMPVSHWYILNLKQTGYFLVNYDESNWKNLVDNLMDFPVEIRSQLLSNAMDLARANLLDYDVPLKMLLTIGRRDNQLLPYMVAFEKVQYIYNQLSTSPIFNKFNTFLGATFHSAFDNTGFLENPTDDYFIHKLRKLILTWACKDADSRCVVQSRHLYRAWIISDKPIAPNVREIVYCTAIREGDEAEFDFAYKQYLNSTSAIEKETILSAMGCTAKPWLLSKYLNMMLDKESGIKKQDGGHVFNSVARNVLGYNMAFDFLRTNWKELIDYYGVAFGRLRDMVKSLTYFMNTPYHYVQLQLFKSENNVETANDEFDNAMERVKVNINWMETCYKSVENWLDLYAEHYGFK